MISSIKTAGMRLSLLLALVLFCSTIQAQNEYNISSIPNVRLSDKHNHVSNPDAIISPAHTDSINAVLNTLEDSTGIQVAVVAVEKLEQDDARLFATELFNKWGLGKKGKDNGLLILLVTNPDQRSVVFETGYGIEGVLPDILCSDIQRKYMIPSMKEGRYSEGMYLGVIETAKVLQEGEPYTGAKDEEDVPWTTVLLNLVLFIAAIYLLFGVVLPFGINLYRKAHPKECPKCGKKTLTFKQNKVVKMATPKHNGLRVETWVCKECGYEEKKEIVITRNNGGGGGYDPNIRRTRHGSTRSSGGGGSWGGGSSGGGGAINRF